MRKKSTKKRKTKKRYRIARNKGTNKDIFKTFVVLYVYGIILLNAGAAVAGYVLTGWNFVYGIGIGLVASLFYLWNLYEEKKRILVLVENNGFYRGYRGFLVRYATMALFLGLSAYIAVDSLIATFLSLFMIRLVIYYIAYKTKHE